MRRVSVRRNAYRPGLLALHISVLLGTLGLVSISNYELKNNFSIESQFCHKYFVVFEEK